MNIATARRSATVRTHPVPVGGFTLIELLTAILILGVLAAFAIPRLISADQSARAASVNSLAGTLKSTAYVTRSLCMATTSCSPSNSSWYGTIGGKTYWLNYGWPDAGDNLNLNQIDTLIDYSGFTAVLTSGAQTRFQRDDAPTPASCSVAYNDAYHSPPNFSIIVVTSGC